MSEYALFTPAEAKAEREKRNKSSDDVTPPAQERTDEEVRLPDTKKRGKQKTSVKAAPSESQQDETENANANAKNQPEARKPSGRKTLKRKIDAFKPSKEDESEDEEPKSPEKKPRLKAKAAKKDTDTAPTRRSTRNQDVYQPSKEDEDDEEEETHDEPSSSAKGGQRKRKAAAVTSVSKKAKTKK